MRIAQILPKKQDIMASLVVFIVALPLSLGVALACGASPAAGIITSIIGGIVIGMFSGAPLVVSGPAAGLVTFVFQLGTEHGFAALSIITLVAGLFQIFFALMRTGKVFLFVPKAVLEGMLAAIGITIVLGQILVIAGEKSLSSPMEALIAIPSAFSQALLDSGKQPILICGIVALLVYLIWEKKNKFFPSIPAALPSVLAATIVALSFDIPRISIAPLIPTMLDSVDTFFSLNFTDVKGAWILAGLSLALIASAESLLTARAIDTVRQSKDPNSEPAQLNKELIAQGLGNAMSGFFGGIPMTGVMVRSSANVNAGAKTRWSTILHGTWMAIFVGLFPFVLQKIPLAALAVVLVLIGIKLINFKHVVSLFQKERMEAIYLVFTAGIIIATDLLMGLCIAIAVYFFSQQMRKKVEPLNLLNRKQDF